MYDSSFYDMIREGCISSANAVAEEFGRVDTVIDVGCGEGHWGKALCNGTPVLMDYDGYESPNRAEGTWIKHDIATGAGNAFGLRNSYDLAICLEVAEHLPESMANELVDFLASCSSQILWSAAIPSQGGLNHINEQWPNYWINKFNNYGYYANFVGDEFWGDPNVEPWYQQNMYWLSRHHRSAAPVQDFTPRIHPAFWATKTGVSYP